MNTTLQIRIDKSTKNKAQKIFKKMGVDMTSGVKLFLNQVVNTESIPFSPRTKNGFTPEYEDKLLKEVEWTEKYGKSYNTIEEAHADILK